MTDTCEKHCEATAFKIVIRGLEVEVARLKERLAQPHETTLKEFNQFIHDDPKYHIWAKEKEALAEKSMREVQRLGQEIEQERNFCPRCGKRTKDMTQVHTCTPKD